MAISAVTESGICNKNWQQSEGATAAWLRRETVGAALTGEATQDTAAAAAAAAVAAT